MQDTSKTPPLLENLGAKGAKTYKRDLDIIGDVHGCFQELRLLLNKLGYRTDDDGLPAHPDGRTLVFVGDLTDRGPHSLSVLDLVEKLVSSDRAILISGNHDNKLSRWLNGNRVRIGHGLQSTIKEFLALSPEKYEESKVRFQKLIDNAPFWLLADPESETRGSRLTEETLVVAHAAWRPKVLRGSTAQAKGFCLYGPTTGQLVNGLPQRLNWKKHYSSKAPFCVVGHTPYYGPVVETHNTICLDTGCVFGGALTAFRWPSREVVQIPATEKWSPLTTGEDELPTEPMLVDHEVAKLESPDVRQVAQGESFDLRLDNLLQRFWDQTETILSLVDVDPQLSKREVEAGPLKGVRIANASAGLFTPSAEHQLFAKGLVYKGSEPVSIPYIKIYNYGERTDTRELANLLAEDGEVTLHFTEKLDGTMVQTFSTLNLDLGEPQVVVTTRGMLTSGPTKAADFDYIREATQVLQAQSPKALDPDRTAGLTLLWEFIHPGARIVTDYEDRKDLTLTGAVAYDAEKGGSPYYLAREDLVQLAERLECPVVSVWELEGTTMKERLDSLATTLGKTDREGAVLTFEGRGANGRVQVLHRVKAKGQEYLRLMRLIFFCSYTSTVEFLKAQPSLDTWDKFREYLKAQGKSRFPEEILGSYRLYFEAYQKYQQNLQEILAGAAEIGARWERQSPSPGFGTPEYRAWKKAFSAWVVPKVPAGAKGYVFSSQAGKLDAARLEWFFNGSRKEATEAAVQIRQALENTSENS